MLTIRQTSKFKKDFRTAMRRGCDPDVFEYVVNELANERQLAEKYRDHPLCLLVISPAQRKLYRLQRMPPCSGLAAHLCD